MKKIIFILLLLGNFTQAQSLQEVFSKYVTPNSSSSELREGIEKLESVCSTSPNEKCNKAKAMAYFLLSNDYYEIAYSIRLIDEKLYIPVFEKAKELFDKGNGYMSINDFSSEQKNMLIDSKNKYDSKFKD